MSSVCNMMYLQCSPIDKWIAFIIHKEVILTDSHQTNRLCQENILRPGTHEAVTGGDEGTGTNDFQRLNRAQNESVYASPCY